MIRKAVKAVTWIVAGFVGLAAVVSVAAVVTNWRDEPPTPDALRLAAAHDSRPPVADEDNAFIYLLGFDAALGQDPRAVGAQRLAWLQTADGKPFDRAADPQTTRLEYGNPDAAVEEFLAACGTDSLECVTALANSNSVFDAWTATHPWLLERYRALIAHDAWRELVPGVAGPWPSFGPALRGHYLLLLQAQRLAAAGDGAAVSTLLGDDARFWRMVLASSDSVLSKMIATAALRTHFAWGTIVMDSLPADDAATIPTAWRAPMTADELSLQRTIVGEWAFLSASLTADGGLIAPSDRVSRALFQPQDTLNRQSAYLTALIETLDAPLLGFANAADDASRLAQRMAEESFPSSLYNLTGAVLLAAGPADYADYARRAADVEGMRRAALAVVTLRREQPADVAAALAASTLRNPYDDEPLRWDENDQAVVFVGLEPGERGEHRFYY
jgi:hypothetical protein